MTKLDLLSQAPTTSSISINMVDGKIAFFIVIKATASHLNISSTSIGLMNTTTTITKMANLALLPAMMVMVMVSRAIVESGKAADSYRREFESRGSFRVLDKYEQSQCRKFFLSCFQHFAN